MSHCCIVFVSSVTPVGCTAMSWVYHATTAVFWGAAGCGWLCDHVVVAHELGRDCFFHCPLLPRYFRTYCTRRQ